MFVANLDTLRTATGAHVAIVHHTGKDKAKGARGHSLLRAATDTEVEIDNRTMTVTKQRDMDGNLSIPFGLKPRRLGVAASGRDITSCTVDMKKPGEAPEPLPLTADEKALVGAIRDRINRDKRDIGTPFKRKFYLECQAELDEKSLTDGVIIFSKEPTTDSRIMTIMEKGWIKNLKRNQYVMVNYEKSEKSES